MSILLSEFIARGVEMALVGIDDPNSYIQTAEVLAETLGPQVLQAVSRDAAGDPLRVQQVQRTHTLSFTDGTATLAANVLTEYLAQSTVDVDGEPTWGPLMAYMSWVDFRNGFDPRLGGYAVHPAGALFFAPPGIPYAVGSGYGGDALLTTPSSPTWPTTAGGSIDISPELEDQAITSLASAIKGQEAWQSLTTRLSVPGDET